MCGRPGRATVALSGDDRSDMSDLSCGKHDEAELRLLRQ